MQNITSNYKSDKSLYDSRKWIDRVRGAPTKKRMWKKRLSQPFPELDALILEPHPAAWVAGSKPRKKKRGRKF